MNNPDSNAQFLASIPVGKWGEPEDIGALARYLCSPAAGFITGTDIVIDGGWLRKIMPSKGTEFEAATYRKVIWRLIPFLFLCYVFAYLDRVNVGFAKLQMQQDLQMSDAVYGMGAGIFFIGYFFFEIPCNLMLQKIGAKRWLGPIMIIWGLVSGCGMLISSSTTFYVQRFAAGHCGIGLFPRCDSVSDVLVSAAVSRAHDRSIHDGDSDFGSDWRPDIRMDFESDDQRGRAAGMAMAAGAGGGAVHSGGARGIGVSRRRTGQRTMAR